MRTQRAFSISGLRALLRGLEICLIDLLGDLFRCEVNDDNAVGRSGLPVVVIEIEVDALGVFLRVAHFSTAARGREVQEKRVLRRLTVVQTGVDGVDFVIGVIVVAILHAQRLAAVDHGVRGGVRQNGAVALIRPAKVQAAALEADAASKDQTYTCTGETIIGGQKIICMGKHGTLSMTQALAHSCNVYYGELAAALGKDKLQAAADRLGLNGTLCCDGYTARSTVDLSDADEGSVAWAGIGQYTDQVTALQFLRFMGVIAGGGEAAEPYLMQKISRAGQTVYEAKTETTGQLLSAATATTLGGMMRSAKLASSLWDSGRAKGLARSR